MTDEEKRLKEIKRLKWIKSEIIKQEKKELKKLTEEENMINGYKRIERENERKSKVQSRTNKKNYR